ncbi:MAG: hypothetical protein JG764_2144 [Clostridiales bacterium]|jgi:accessory gene regulator B|nr:hypothetical protein [Clostridiales bacterium]
MSINDISVFLANNLAEILDYNEEQADILRYGFEVIIGEFTKITILLILALLLNILPQAIVALLTISVYRLLSGGIHCKTYRLCFITSLVSLLCIGKFAREIPAYIEMSSFILIVLTILVFITSIFAVIKWAPVDSNKRPVTIEEKKKFKILSFIWIWIWFVIIFIIISVFSIEKIQSLVLASIFAHLVQTFTLFPTVSKI